MSRFDRSPAPELIDSAFRFENEDAPLLHHDLTLADLAHLLHLSEQRLIPPDCTQSLLQLVLELEDDTSFVYDPARGDAFTNREDWLAARAPHAVGYYALGRARREATTIAFRLLTRRALLDLIQANIELQAALLDCAAQHIETLMPDYTYLQQAHPTTLAHYLLGSVFPLRRDFGRLQTAFALVNQSPAGIGSTNGSRLPLRRERLAELLGFDGVISHTRDAMWQVDAPIQALSAAATLLLHLDRLAEDLQIFNSIEFGLVELADEFARASVIMPQKKNPYALSFVRGAAGALCSRVAEMYMVARTPSGQVDNRIFAHGTVPRALSLATRCVRLMTGVIRTIHVNVEQMRRRVEAGFTQATDLAETLAVMAQVPYATAHQIVARVVRQLVSEGKTLHDLTVAQLSAVAQEITAQPLRLDAAQLAEALNPMAILATRVGIGGAAPARVREMLDECRADLESERAWSETTRRRIDDAETRLLSHARRLTLDV